MNSPAEMVRHQRTEDTRHAEYPPRTQSRLVGTAALAKKSPPRETKQGARSMLWMVLSLTITVAWMTQANAAPERHEVTLDWEDDILTVRGEHIPGGEVEILYLEAYCRPNSQTTDWVEHTVVGHTTELVSISDDRQQIKLRCTLDDGVVVDHTITAVPEGVDFQVEAHNPTDQVSEAHWAQPCIRVGKFTGTGADVTDNKYAYLPKSFIFLDGDLVRMPTRDWATEARYTPGQVWAAPGVDPADVNPRPLNPNRPSNGLIGCFSADSQWILASAWQPYQELFQGVIRCLHSDFRIGGLEPGETKQIRGKLYIVPNDLPALVKRYRQDFPEHR